MNKPANKRKVVFDVCGMFQYLNKIIEFFSFLCNCCLNDNYDYDLLDMVEKSLFSSHLKSSYY